MATYPIDQIITEYGNEHMDVEMTTGHALQHIKQLYQESKTANHQRQELRDRLQGLEARLTTFQTKTEHRNLRAKVTQLQHDVDLIRAKLNRLWTRQEQSDQIETMDMAQLTALSLTVYQVKAVLDSLKHQLGLEDVADSAKN